MAEVWPILATSVASHRSLVVKADAMQQTEPGSLPRERAFLLTAWLPLNQYVPELRERFMQLEALSRTPGKDASLPTKSNEELDQENFNRKQREALNGGSPNEPSIDLMITQEDFETARKLIDKLPDGERKTTFTEQVNRKQAISLAKKGDLLAAQNLAERLTTVGSILEVYPSIVERYAGDKDQVGASAAVHLAMKQLKTVKSKPPAPIAPFGMPSEFMPTASERDGIVSALGKLAKAVLLIDTLLGAQVVDEMVETANRSPLDTSQGRTGFDADLFKSLAARDEVRARSAAENFKDRLRRMVAIAAIYQWKAKEFEKRTPRKAAQQGR